MAQSLRPVGIAMAVVGNLLFAIGFGGVIGQLTNWDGDVVSSGFLLAAGRSLAMLAAGYLLARFAPRFGGGSLSVQFLVIGLTSMWSAFHATDWAGRLTSGFIGTIFLLVAVIGLFAIAAAHGWKHSLTHASPMILRAGAVPQPFNITNLATALQSLSHTPATAIRADSLTADQRASALRQIDQLQASGTLSAEQVDAMKAWLEPPQPDATPHP